jgi:hypothetical protein
MFDDLELPNGKKSSDIFFRDLGVNVVPIIQ